ncbi:MAG: glycosyltransferase family 39 protein [Bacteroidales bacterium]
MRIFRIPSLKNLKQALPYLAFIFLLLILYAWYDYAHIIKQPPQSVHRWRQADCASLTLNYYQHGMEFFKPRVHNLTSDGGTSPYSCPAEVPVLYYFTAGLYKIFGPDDSILRAVNLLLFSLGIFHLFLLFRLVLKQAWFWPLALSFFFASSPLLAYYANNYLSDITALSFAWMAAYYFFRYVENRSLYAFYTSAFLMLMAAFCKITALLFPVALIAVLVLESTGLIRFSGTERTFHKPWLQFLVLSGILLLLACWVLYAKWFNHQHASLYFSTMVRPYWSLPERIITASWNNIRNVWLTTWFSIPAWSFFLVSLIVPVFFFRKAGKLIPALAILLLVGVVSFFLLEFMFFMDHDYYAINLYILPVFSLLALFKFIGTVRPGLLSSWIFKGLVMLIVVFSANESRKLLEERYSEEVSGMLARADYLTVRPWLEKAGIKSGDPVIALPGFDHSALYLLNQPGWTEYFEWTSTPGIGFYHNRDSAGIARSIKHGARFLLVYGNEELFSRPYLAPFTNDLAGIYKNIWIFRLNSKDTNFVMKPGKLMQSFYWNLEKTTPDGADFLDSLGLIVSGNAAARSATFSTSGKYSIRLQGKDPYGLTTVFSKVAAGEYFKVSVLRKSASIQMPESSDLPGMPVNLLFQNFRDS